MIIINYERKMVNKQAGELFVENYEKYYASHPVLPQKLMDAGKVAGYLYQTCEEYSALAAAQDGEILGYLGWFVFDNFRDTGRRAAFTPVWAHAALEEHWALIYRELYQAAAQRWQAQGCEMMAATFLAADDFARDFWFWNGYGMTVVDAVRALDPLGVPDVAGLSIRKADLSDLDTLAELDAAHCAHYTAAPVWMCPRTASDREFYKDFLENEPNSIWLALQAGKPVGYMQFEQLGTSASEIVRDDGTISITGAYVDPDHREQKAAAHLLDAGLAHYRQLGFKRCATDFESFNPNAAGFWKKYFEPVCYSAIRHPEAFLKQP